jgi:hypothetical protein
MYVHDNSVSNCARVRTHATTPIVVYECRISHDPTLQEDTRVPEREEQEKPSKDARRGRCHLLESVFGPCG